MSNKFEKLLISDEDLYILNDYSVWKDISTGYYRISLGKRKYIYLHRFILNAKTEQIVDHINGNKDDNRRENLRLVDKKLNNYNKPIKNNLGRGIYFDTYGKNYRACISHNNKTLKLGRFKTIEEAKLAYNIKAKEIYGEDAFQHKL